MKFGSTVQELCMDIHRKKKIQRNSITSLDESRLKMNENMQYSYINWTGIKCNFFNKRYLLFLL